ncbi:MAG: PTS sugar transporter subunit IIC [Clostridia bacterium]|nr:PTS sugar transporter subunit IIC [Clostridia bacterium]
MKKLKEILSYIFIDGLSGMAMGLFGTLIIGTILEQIAAVIPGIAGDYLRYASLVAKSLTGAGIGVGMAFKYKVSPLVGAGACVSGMVGAFASKILAGSVITEAGMLFSGPGDPLSAFIGAMCAIQIGKLISGKTKLDIILTPACSILAGSAAGLLLGPPVSIITTKIGELIVWGTERQPVMMGVIVSVVMGICLTLPISSAALGIILGLNGIAGGAAVVGCSAHMIGFAVMSYRENKLGGLLAQGVGTSMLQMPNLLKKPVLWLPPVITSAILGPISTRVLKMTCKAAGSGMGTSGLVGQIMTFTSMTESGFGTAATLIEMAIMHFIAPAILCLIISELMRKKGLIKYGDLKLEDA